jgi:hypothetical protein
MAAVFAVEAELDIVFVQWHLRRVLFVLRAPHADFGCIIRREAAVVALVTIQSATYTETLTHWRCRGDHARSIS